MKVDAKQKLSPLTDEQRRRVDENLGLVGANYRVFCRGPKRPRHDWEWDDLYQEGCLALMQAARNYPDDCVAPFAAFASRRIRTAMIMALEQSFTSVKLPQRRRGRDAEAPKTSSLGHRPKRILAGEYQFEATPDRRHDPRSSGDDGDAETLGDRLRVLYDRAVDKIATRHGRRPGKRGDLGELVEKIAEQRLRMPEESYRTSLRELAQDTQSSFARVRGCDLRLRKAVRRELMDDAVFKRLRAEVRRHPEGYDGTLEDADVEV